MIRISNEMGYLPGQVKSLTKALRHSFHDLNIRIGGLRLSSKAIEFDAFSDDEMDVRFVSIACTYGLLLTMKQLDHSVASGSVSDIVSKAKDYFNEERFWETHEILEGVWKKSKNSEKTLLQGLILIAGAYVHLQRDENDTCLSMLKRALPKLGKEERYHSLDIKRCRDFVRGILKTRKVALFKL